MSSGGAKKTDGVANADIGGSRRSVSPASASSRANIEPNGYPQDEVLKYVISAFDGVLPMTLRDAYGQNHKYPWEHFLHAASQLVAGGYLEGRGDGFEVKYSLKSNGRNNVGRTP